jgi:hypothetical protein
MILRKIRDWPGNSLGVQSRQGGICRSRRFTLSTSLRQLGRDGWDFLEQVWIAHNRVELMPSLLPDLLTDPRKPPIPKLISPK